MVCKFLSVKEMHGRHFLVEDPDQFMFPFALPESLKGSQDLSWCCSYLGVRWAFVSAASGPHGSGIHSGIHSGSGTELVSRTASREPLTTGTTKGNPKATYVRAWGCGFFYLLKDWRSCQTSAILTHQENCLMGTEVEVYSKEGVTAFSRAVDK